MRILGLEECAQELHAARDAMIDAASALNRFDLTVDERIALQESLIKHTVRLSDMAKRFLSIANKNSE